jgi:hypothetical protein
VFTKGANIISGQARLPATKNWNDGTEVEIEKYVSGRFKVFTKVRTLSAARHVELQPKKETSVETEVEPKLTAYEKNL